jgi:chemotaxis protein methyltransferase CheR
MSSAPKLNLANESIVQATATIPITEIEFERIRRLLHEKSGIHLTPEKRSLVVGRLVNILKKRACTTFTEYLDKIAKDPTGAMLSELVDNMSTNHTFFFRESVHFDFFINNVFPGILAKLKAANSNDIRLWCAASSSGEEPYCLQMLMDDYLKADYSRWKAGMLATDISSKVLDIAKRGNYEPERLERIPEKFLKAYFTKEANGSYTIIDRIKNEIVWRRFNLIKDRFPFNSPFHCIFCRNVMIYFDKETKIKLVKNLQDFLFPGGYLFIGHSESLNHTNTKFKYVMPALYRKEG